jgi:hypothetical protein
MSHRTVFDERMLEWNFFFMKSSPVSSQSVCASCFGANCGVALSREKPGIQPMAIG